MPTPFKLRPVPRLFYNISPARRSLIEFAIVIPLIARVVLVRARNPLNIGAAARAMANFGFRDLRLVSPYQLAWEEARSAVGAQQVIASAKVTKTLMEAVSDCNLVLATSSGQRRTLDRPVVALPELESFLTQKTAAGEPVKIALVFGSEKTGLANSHIALSHAVLNIPTSPQTPSMNLGQAVAVCCYGLGQITGSFPPPESTQTSQAPDAAEINAALFEIDALLFDAGFQKGSPPETRRERIRKALYNTRLLRTDLFLLRAIVRRLKETAVSTAAQKP